MANQHHIKVRHPALVEGIRSALVGVGVRDEHAAVESELMAEADLLGVPSHGVRMLPRLIASIKQGSVNTAPHIEIIRDRNATCVLEGDHGLGRYISVQAMNHAVERARRFGIGSCLARNTCHWGRAHAYAYRAAMSGMIGICMTNAIGGMRVPGSLKARIGNNPLAIAVPRGEDRDPVVLDMAMSQAAVGKIVTYQREGRRVPLGWGLDRNGRPTDDPAAILESGNYLPMGGHKGAGLALMIDLLTGALAGGMLSCEMTSANQGNMDIEASKLFIAMDCDSFGDRSVFNRRTEDLLAHLQASPAGETPARFPGQHGWTTRDRYLSEGIPVETQVIEDLSKLGVTLTGRA